MGMNKTKFIMWCIDHVIDTDAFYRTMALLPDALDVKYERVQTDKEIDVGFYFKDLHHTLVMGSTDGIWKRFEIDHITSKGIRCATVALNPARLVEYLTA